MISGLALPQLKFYVCVCVCVCGGGGGGEGGAGTQTIILKFMKIHKLYAHHFYLTLKYFPSSLQKQETLWAYILTEK